MRRSIHLTGAIYLALMALVVARASLAQPDGPAVSLVEFEGTVNPGSADHLVRALRVAQERGSAALIVRLDTPGGMVESTREIVKSELASSVPVVVWVGPAGARAGSAGVFITLAAHVAAMAPATNIGAAHPVAVGPGGSEAPDETISEKLVNDLAAWAEGIARQRGRNGEWAADAVRRSVSVPAEKALELKVVDLIAPDLPALLKALDGRRVETASGTVTLATAGRRVERIDPSPRERVLDALGDPNIAFLLIGLGILGVLAELYHPGTFIPGTLGVVAFALGMVATRMLPVRSGAIVLMIVGAGLVAAEFFVTSYGILGVLGTGCLVLGGFLLIDPSDPRYLVDEGFGVRWSTVLPLIVVVGSGLALVAWKVAVARAAPETTGAGGLLNEEGVVVEEVGPDRGKVFVHGELWEARSAVPLARDERVRIERVEGLVARVARAEPR